MGGYEEECQKSLLKLAYKVVASAKARGGMDIQPSPQTSETETIAADCFKHQKNVYSQRELPDETKG